MEAIGRIWEKKIAQVAAAVLGIAALLGVAEQWLGWPPYQSRAHAQAEIERFESRVGEAIELATLAILQTLYIQYDNALNHKFRYQQAGEPVPRELEDRIRRLCRQIEEEGGRC